MDNIEKARQVGDMHPTKPYIWTEYKPGKFDWRPVKGKKSISNDSNASGGNKVSNDNSNTSKVTPKPSTGKLKAMNMQQLAGWATTTNEANLLKVANAQNANAQMRKIAYDELVKRGVDTAKINTAGTLQQLMKMTGAGQKQNQPVSTKTDDQEDNQEVDENGDHVNNITEKWYLDKSDDRVKKMFNLKTKEGRIKYDAFVYKMKKKEKDYMNPVEVVQDLNEQYLEFLENDEQRFMISAGGAGIGKSYGFHKMAELLNKKPFEEGDSPGDGDYDYFEAPDVNSGKQLLNILKAHNGKIIVFDDNDKVLKRQDCASVMKKATSTTGRRIVGDPDDVKQNFEFTGRIIIMTNKDLAALAESEDTKAIISRAMMVSEIYMTVPETIQVMESRYQDYEFSQAPRLDDEKDDKSEREEILKLIKDNAKNIDPVQFTTRTFQEILINKRKVDNANEKRKNPAFALLIGQNDKDWKEKALATLTKASTQNELSYYFNSVDELEKSEESSELEKAENLLLYDEEDDVVKAKTNSVLLDDFSDINLEKAEDLLLS